jgi:hypothetical protein
VIGPVRWTLGRSAARFVIAYAVLAPLYLAPLVATRFLPALDLPHHLAIADALAKASSPDSPYAKLYTVELRLAPFDAHFALLLALSSWMPLGVAGKVLVGLQVLGLPVACARLLAACGRSTLPALLAFPLGYAMPVHYGLIAFVLAVPVLVWVFAEAADEPAWRRRPGRQAVVLAAGLLALFFCHLEAYALGVVAAAMAVAAHRTIPLRARSLGLVAALPSVAALFLYGARTTPSEAPAEATVARAFVTMTAQELTSEGVGGRLASRARGLPVHLLRGFRDGADVRASYAFYGIVLGVALLAWRVPAGDAARDRTRLGAAACLGLTALAAYFILPHHVPPHAHSIYPRFALVVALTALLAIPARLSGAHPRTLDLAAAAMVLAGAVYAGVLRGEYAAFGHELADFAAVIDAVPPGHAAGGLVFDAESGVMNVEGIFSGMPAYYATERRAPGTSTFLHYCGQAHLPCHPLAPDAPPALPHFTQPERLDPRRALEDIDLFLVRGGPAAEAIFGAETPRLRLAAQDGSWRAFLRP